MENVDFRKNIIIIIYIRLNGHRRGDTLMGMAATQARYLGLTARKTNTEYEGQQINQARTALANQSANLWNRM